MLWRRRYIVMNRVNVENWLHFGGNVDSNIANTV